MRLCSGPGGISRIATGIHICGCLSDSDDRMVCLHRTEGSVSSQRILEKEQMARYLNFKVAAPPTASAWTSIVRHCGQLARPRRIDYHKDDLGQPPDLKEHIKWSLS